MLRVVVVDDEVPARRHLRRLLSRHPNVELVGEADHVGSGVELIERVLPDAAFLDIGLPGVSGFEILRRLPAPLRVVIVTACADHAVRAFEVGAIHYLLKPVSAARLAEAIARLTGASRAVEHRPSPVDERPVIRLRSAQRTLVVALDRVLALHAQGDFSKVQIEGMASVLVPQPLKLLERELPRAGFLRLSRSLIVNCRRLEEIEYRARGQARVALFGDPERLALGRVATMRLRAWAGRAA